MNNQEIVNLINKLISLGEKEEADKLIKIANPLAFAAGGVMAAVTLLSYLLYQKYTNKEKIDLMRELGEDVSIAKIPSQEEFKEVIKKNMKKDSGKTIEKILDNTSGDLKEEVKKIVEQDATKTPNVSESLKSDQRYIIYFQCHCHDPMYAFDNDEAARSTKKYEIKVGGEYSVHQIGDNTVGTYTAMDLDTKQVVKISGDTKVATGRSETVDQTYQKKLLECKKECPKDRVNVPEEKERTKIRVLKEPTTPVEELIDDVCKQDIMEYTTVNGMDMAVIKPNSGPNNLDKPVNFRMDRLRIWECSSDAPDLSPRPDVIPGQTTPDLSPRPDVIPGQTRPKTPSRPDRDSDKRPPQRPSYPGSTPDYDPKRKETGYGSGSGKYKITESSVREVTRGNDNLVYMTRDAQPGVKGPILYLQNLVKRFRRKMLS